MSAGIRSTSLPLGALVEVIGHFDTGGGVRSVGRMSLGELTNRLLGLAGMTPSEVAAISARLTKEIEDRGSQAEAIYEAIGERTPLELFRSLETNLANLQALLQSQIEDRASLDLFHALETNIANLQELLLDKIGDEAATRYGDDQRNAGAIQALSLVLGHEIDDLVDGVASALTAISSGDRPGVSPRAFARSAVGPILGLPPLDLGGGITTPLGRGYRILGAGIIAPRAAIPIDADTISVLRARYWRLTDVLDPNNNAVDLGIQWLDASDADAGTTLIRRERDLSVQSGPHMLTMRVPSLASDMPALTPPRGAVSWRPYLRTYGGDGATAVAILGARDATFSGVYAPDVSAVADRLAMIEGRIAAGLPFSTPILPSYAVADLPRPGTPGRKAFARDGRAPSAAGALEAANSGTGVEVTDNGTAWVITGTNQQVQA